MCYSLSLSDDLLQKEESLLETQKIFKRDQKIKELFATIEKLKLVQNSQEEKILLQLQQISDRDNEIKDLLAVIKHLELIKNELNQVYSSKSWKLGLPVRLVNKFFINVSKLYIFKKSSYKKAWAILKFRGFRQLIFCIHNKIITKEITNYQNWIERYDTVSNKDREIMVKHVDSFTQKPLISIIMPVYNIDVVWLGKAIDSVLSQLYPYWELCIADDCSTDPKIKKLLQKYTSKDDRIKVIFREKNAHISECSNSALSLSQGEFIALLDHDDELTETALYYVACEINKYPNVDLIYSDEDKINEKGERYGPYFKSDWNPDLFYGLNMFSHLGVYRRALVNKIGGFRIGYEGSQDYDLCLRCLKETTADKIRHIPRILYHWRAIAGSTALEASCKDYAAIAARCAIKDFFSDVNPLVEVEEAPLHPNYHRLRWPIPNVQPKVTLIVPTRNGLALLSKCISSILNITEYKNYNILIVNNQSDDVKTLDYFKKIIASNSCVQILDYDAPFNFSALNNFAVNHVNSDLIGFINNDIEAIHADWLTEMVSHAIRKEIGAVGAKLYYPDNTVQHGGVLLGAGAATDAVAGHLFHGLRRENPGYFARAHLTQSLSAVTAACLIMRKDVFYEVNGFNEEHLRVAFNDVDLCLKIRQKGYRIIWTPFAELYHHESATRGFEDTLEKMTRFQKEVTYMRSRWGGQLDNDPYYNPNLSLRHANFSLNDSMRAE